MKEIQRDIDLAVRARREFYDRCALLLGVRHDFVDRVPRPRWDRRQERFYLPPSAGGRWSGRQPGNGRFPPYGVIRYFSANCIRVNLAKPKAVSGTFESPEAVYELLEGLGLCGRENLDS